MRLVVALALRAALVVAAAGACSNKARSTPTCNDAAQAIDAMVKRSKSFASAPDATADTKARARELEAIAPRWRAALVNRCTDDKWPADAIACHAKVTVMDEMRACRSKLSSLQAARMLDAELAVMDVDTALQGLGAPPVATSPTIDRLQAELRQLNERLAQATKKAADAPNDADRAAANEELRRLQVEMQRVNEQLANERANAGSAAP